MPAILQDPEPGVGDAVEHRLRIGHRVEPFPIPHQHQRRRGDAAEYRGRIVVLDGFDMAPVGVERHRIVDGLAERPGEAVEMILEIGVGEGDQRAERRGGLGSMGLVEPRGRAQAVDVERIGLRRRGGKDQGGDAVGVARGHVLADAPAHRIAEHMRPLDPEPVEQADRVIGELRDRIAARRRLRLAGAPVVERDGAEFPGEGGDLVRPGVEPVAEAHQQEQRMARAPFVIVEGDAVDDGPRHVSPSRYAETRPAPAAFPSPRGRARAGRH